MRLDSEKYRDCEPTRAAVGNFLFVWPKQGRLCYVVSFNKAKIHTFDTVKRKNKLLTRRGGGNEEKIT